MHLKLRLFGRDLHLATTKAAGPLRPVSSGGWRTAIHEPFIGAWQQNAAPVEASSVLPNPTVFACVTLIAADVSKLGLRLVAQDDAGIWTETDSPAFSPFLRKPNRYQTRINFVESWMISKLTRGNTYALKQRDARGIVVAAYVLDPTHVTPLVTPTGDVYYEIKRDDLSGQPRDAVIVPASEIFHDRMNTIFHPLVGVSPIFACGIAAQQGLKIHENSAAFFANGANPSGMLTAPGAISDETARRLLATVAAKKPGETLVGGDGLKYEQFTMSAVDAQLIEQLKWSAETICSVFHVPAYMIGVGPPPPYANIEPLLQQYYSQCIQSLLNAFELCLDDGLGLAAGKIDGRQLGTEFDIDDLIWMDTLTKTKAAADAIGSAAMSPNEARRKYFGLGAIAGGESAYLQVQNYSLEALARRDAGDPFAPPAPARVEDDELDADEIEASLGALLVKELAL